MRLKLAQAGLAICAAGVGKLADGTALVLKAEANRFGPNGKALAVHLAATGERCGFIGNAEVRLARPGDATAVWASDEVVGSGEMHGQAGGGQAGGGQAGGGQWMVDACEAVGTTIEVGDDWELNGALVEVKTKNDSLWCEQRMWLRSLLEPGFLSYTNPYLFDATGVPTINISVCKVTDPKKKQQKKKQNQGEVGKEEEEVVEEEEEGEKGEAKEQEEGGTSSSVSAHSGRGGGRRGGGRSGRGGGRGGRNKTCSGGGKGGRAKGGVPPPPSPPPPVTEVEATASVPTASGTNKADAIAIDDENSADDFQAPTTKAKGKRPAAPPQAAKAPPTAAAKRSKREAKYVEEEDEGGDCDPDAM